MDTYTNWIFNISMRIGLSLNGEQQSYQEIKTWCEISGVHLDVGEIELVHDLSREYIASRRFYEHEDNKHALPPIFTEVSQKRMGEQHARRRIEQMMARKTAIQASSTDEAN